MPLLKAKLYETDLRSKPFGFDRPNGGSSNQPYIVTTIPTGSSPSSPDFLLRNGYLNFVNSLTDAERIGKWFIDIKSPNGLLFTAKQELLERQNVDVNDGINRIYNPLGTEAQVGAVSIGYHLNKQGFNIFRQGYYNDGENGYFSVTKKNEDEQHSRLQLLYQVKRVGSDTANVNIQKRKLNNQLAIAGATLSTIGFLGVGAAALTGAPTGQILGASAIGLAGLGLFLKSPTTTVSVNLANRLYGITKANDDINLISYSGGPGSFLGIGKTNIRIWNPLQFKNYFTETGTNITKNEDQPQNPQLYLTPTDGNIVGASTIRESLLNTSKTSFSRKRNGQVKVLNPNLSISADQVIPDEGDIINFYFELINNDDTTKNTKIPLRAYIEDFNDSFNGEWDAYKYMGRAESFYRYKGFTRDFSLSFMVPTLSRTDLITNYQKLNALSWLTMPDYSDKGYIRGNLAYLTIGNYLERAVIVMKSISFAPIMEMGFDINRDENYKIFEVDNPLYTGQLPKGIKVQCSITPLTQMTIKEDNKELFYTPQRGEAFIGNRVHTIKDRPDTIGKQYINESGSKAIYSANNPESSDIFTTGNPTANQSSVGPTFRGTFQEPNTTDILFTK